MRLFLAIDMPPKVQAEAADIQRCFQEQKFFIGRYTDPYALHMTLKFLGELPESELSTIDAALSTVTEKSFELHTGALGLFPSEIHPKILYWHMYGDGLQQLVDGLNKALPDFARDKRPFIGHCTLARIQTVQDQFALQHYVNTCEPLRFVWKVNEFMLKQSIPTGEGHRHEMVKRYGIL